MTDISLMPARPVRTRVLRGLRGLRGEDWLGLAVIAVLIVLVLAPLAAVLVQAFVPGLFSGQPAQPGFTGLAEVFQRPLWQRSLSNSLFLAGIAALLGGAIGTGLALARQAPGQRLGTAMDASAWAVIVLPSFILAQGWTLFAARSGLAFNWLGLEWMPALIFNKWGLAAIMSLKAAPYAYLTTQAALRWKMEDYSQAARLCGASEARVLWTVRLPMLLPAILSGMVLIFIDVLGDFGLPAALSTTYRFPTLTYAIYVAINQSPIRFDLAGVLAFYVTVMMLIAVLAYLWLLRRSRHDFLGGTAQIAEQAGGRVRLLPNLAVVLALLLMLVVPIGSSFLVSITDRITTGPTWDNLTLTHFAAVLGERSAFLSALGTSTGIAAMAALGSGVIAAAAAYVLVFSDFRLKPVIDVTCTLSLAVPGVVLGIGYIFVWNAPIVDQMGLSIYGTRAILIVAAIAGAVPISIRVMLGAMAQVPATMLQSAALQGASMWRRLATILIPLTATALISAMLTAFGSSVFDLAINAILRPARLDVLPVHVNRAFEQGLFGQATAATLLAGALVVGVIVIIRTGSARALRALMAPAKD